MFNDQQLIIELLVLLYYFRDDELIKDITLKNPSGNLNNDNKYDKIFNFVSQDIPVDDFDQFKLIVDQYVNLKQGNWLELLDSISLSMMIDSDNKIYSRQLILHKKENFEEIADIFETYPENYKILIWYYLCRFISTDLLVINYIVKRNLKIENFIHQNLSYIKIGDKILNNIFYKGLAEIHVHLNGAVYFENQFWYFVGKKNVTRQRNDFLKKLQVFNNLKSTNLDLVINIRFCILIRYYLMSYLDKKIDNKDIDFYDFIATDQELCYLFKCFCHGELYSFSDIQKRMIVDQKINYKIEELDRKLLNNDGDDYISKFIDLKINGKENEYYFLYKSLQYIKYHGSNDDYYNIIFNNYIRIKNAIFRQKIQSDKTKGLSLFTHYFSAQNGIIPIRDRYKMVLKDYISLDYIRYLELRKSLTSHNNTEIQIYKSLIKDIKCFIDIYYSFVDDLLNSGQKNEDDLALMVGIIYHFQKKSETIENICIKKYLDNNDIRYLYFAKTQRDYELKYFAIQKLRSEIPELSKFILGIDTAGNEHNIEPYVFAPIYALNRKHLHNNYQDTVPNHYKELGMTYHVGEVFHSIISGLRHVDEVITYCYYKSLDRLGHALSIMIDIESYLKQKKSTKIPIIEYLENLLYIYQLRSKGISSIEINEIELTEKIHKCTLEIFDSSSIPISLLLEWYNNKFNFIDEIVSGISMCQLKCRLYTTENEELWTLEKLQCSRHCRYYLKKMNRIISIKEGIEDAKLYSQIQKYLRLKIQSKGIVIESNPISNARIGYIDNEFNSMLPSVFSKHLNENHEQRMLITLNTDDPAVFNTNLIYQYVIMEHQLLEKGYSKKDVRDWLEEIRISGIESTFFDKKPITYNQLKKLLYDISINLSKISK